MLMARSQVADLVSFPQQPVLFVLSQRSGPLDVFWAFFTSRFPLHPSIDVLGAVKSPNDVQVF